MRTTTPVSVPATASSVAAPYSFEYGDDYAFFDARGGLTPDYYQKLLTRANQEIEIWDTHTTPNDWKVFKDVVCPDLKITIMTICDKDFKTEQDVKDLANNIKNNLRTEVAKLELRIFAFHDKFRYSEKLWHDRFLVIDKQFYYLIGPSLNNQIGSTTTFGIHNLSKSADRVLLEKKLNIYRPMTQSVQLRHKVSRFRP